MTDARRNAALYDRIIGANYGDDVRPTRAADLPSSAAVVAPSGGTSPAITGAPAADRLLIIGMVGIFRKCRQCGVYFKNANSSARCWYCCKDLEPLNSPAAPTRTLTITEKGRAYLRGET